MNYPNKVIRTGSMDPNNPKDQEIVIAIQKKLQESGCGTFEFIGSYGPKTIDGVRQFQATRTDQFGNALLVDGEVGAVTWAALFGEDTVPKAAEPNSTFLKEVLNVAKSQVGVMESPLGSNKGPEVNSYLKSVDCPPGNFWCAAFVHWCFDEAARRMAVKNPACKTAGCIDHWQRSAGKKISADVASDNPALLNPGAVFIIDHGKGLGHTGFVERVEGGWIHTIEGNSNNGGSRNGLGVFRLKRKINSVSKGFISYA